MQYQNEVLIYVHFFQLIASSLLNSILSPELQNSAFHLHNQPKQN